MKIAVKSLDNKEVGNLNLQADVWGVEPRADILQRMVRWQLAKRQAGTHKTKTQGEIALTGKKPYKQKGTGNARQGSLKEAQMRKGATIFGPVVRSHAHELPKKVRQLALKMALSSKASAGKLVIIDSFDGKSFKTKELKSKFEAFSDSSKLVIGNSSLNEAFARAARNIKHLDVLPLQGLNVYDILRRDTLVMSQDAVEAITQKLLNSGAKKDKTATSAQSAKKTTKPKKASGSKEFAEKPAKSPKTKAKKDTQQDAE